MAQVTSSRPLDDIEPDAEAHALRALSSLPGRVQVFHSVPFVKTGKEGARDGEIDIVIADPERGLLVLEVKGGKEVGFDPGGRGWYSVSLGGEVHTIKDPYGQAKRGLYALRDEIQRSGLFSPDGSMPLVYGWGCVIPQSRFDASTRTPMHVSSERTIDMADLQDPQGAVEAMFGHWAGERSGPSQADSGAVQAVVDQVLAPSFSTDRPLRYQIEEEAARFVALTREQTRIYDDFLKANRRALVEGHAGTGKTVLAERRATELADAGENTLFLCFNRMLADHLKEKLLDVENLQVATFHEMADLLSGHAEAQFPDNPDQAFWDEGAADLLFDAVEEAGVTYDAVIVDEAQDFRSTWWLPVHAMVAEGGRFYVFCDRKQNLFDTDLSELDALPTTLPLTTNCRTTQSIRRFLGRLVDVGDLEDADHLVEGEAVATRSYSEREEQVEMMEGIVRSLKGEGVSSSDIVLLSPFTREKSVLGERLGGWHVEPYTLEDPPESVLYHATIPRFKGLEAPVVLLFDVVADHVACTDRKVYAGASRAQNRLYLLHEEEWAPPRAEAS
jgi:hypothetical protein